MPTVESQGTEIHYVERGAGEQTVVLAHSYLVDHRQFEGQIAALEKSYRVIAYDHRDHGNSSRASTQYALDDLVNDALTVIGHTSAQPCHFVGLSTGGFVGLRLALHHRELLRSLVLMDTSAQAEPLYKRMKYQAMFLALRALGTSPVLGTAMRAMFGRTPRNDPDRAATLRVWRERIKANDPAALIRFGNAIFARDNVLSQLNNLDIPTLITVGEEDAALPLPLSQHMTQAIQGARLEVIAKSGHLNTIESPAAVNAVLVPFIESAS